MKISRLQLRYLIKEEVDRQARIKGIEEVIETLKGISGHVGSKLLRQIASKLEGIKIKPSDIYSAMKEPENAEKYLKTAGKDLESILLKEKEKEEESPEDAE